jgi:hypothetical protein
VKRDYGGALGARLCLADAALQRMRRPSGRLSVLKMVEWEIID